MPNYFLRFQQSGDLHFITFSCHDRRPYLNTPTTRDLFEQSLETIPTRYRFSITGYVVMPEHVHLLLSEPHEAPLATAIQALKLSVTKQTTQRPFWQKRYYDFNVFSESKRIEKLRYLHRNPVTRCLVAEPDQWPWSSFNQWRTGQPGIVTIDTHHPSFP